MPIFLTINISRPPPRAATPAHITSATLTLAAMPTTMSENEQRTWPGSWIAIGRASEPSRFKRSAISANAPSFSHTVAAAATAASWTFRRSASAMACSCRSSACALGYAARAAAHALSRCSTFGTLARRPAHSFGLLQRRPDAPQFAGDRFDLAQLRRSVELCSKLSDPLDPAGDVGGGWRGDGHGAGYIASDTRARKRAELSRDSQRSIVAQKGFAEGDAPTFLNDPQERAELSARHCGALVEPAGRNGRDGLWRVSLSPSSLL